MSSAASKPLADYAVIGNCRSAALVAKDGAIDFPCWPRFDSPALFSALLDDEQRGTFSVRPVSSASSNTERYYAGIWEPRGEPKQHTTGLINAALSLAQRAEKEAAEAQELAS